MNNENIVKKTCRDLGLTYRELGDIIGLTEGSIKRLVATDEVNNQVKASINLLLENIKLKEEIKDFHTLKHILAKV